MTLPDGPDHDRFAELVARSRPTVDTSMLADESAELSRSVVRDLNRRRRSQRRRRLTFGIVAAAVVIPTTAAGIYQGVRTGRFGDPTRFTEDVDRSEVLNLCSPDFADVVRKHQPDGPLPSPYRWETATKFYIREARTSPECGPDGHGLNMQETGVPSQFAFYAQCAWLHEGFAAVERGDTEAMAKAADELRAVADSEIMRAVDGGGVVKYQKKLADDVAAGRLDVLKSEYSVTEPCAGEGE